MAIRLYYLLIKKNCTEMIRYEKKTTMQFYLKNRDTQNVFKIAFLIYCLEIEHVHISGYLSGTDITNVQVYYKI